VYGLAILALLAGIAAFFFMVSRLRRIKPSRMARSAMQFAVWALILLQTVAQVGSSAPTGLVPELARVYGWLAVFELDPGVAVHSACLGTMPMANETVVLTTSSVLVLGLLGVIALSLRHLFVVRPARRAASASTSVVLKGLRQAASQAVGELGKRTLRGRAVAVVYTALSVLFALVMKTAMGLLACVPDRLQPAAASNLAGKHPLQRFVLASNRFVQCYVSPHSELAVLGGFVVVLLPVTMVLYAVMAQATVIREAALARDGRDAMHGSDWWLRCSSCRCCDVLRERQPSAPRLSEALPGPALKTGPRRVGRMSFKPQVLRGDGSMNPMHVARAGGSSAFSWGAPGAPKPPPTLDVRLKYTPETLPLLRSEYKPKEAPLYRLLDFGLIVVLSAANVLFDGRSAAQAAASSSGGAGEAGAGVRGLAALAAAATAVAGNAALTIVACLIMVVLLTRLTPGGPYLTHDAWKRPVRIGSLCLVGTAAMLNAIAASADAQVGEPGVATRAAVVGLSWVVFVLIIFTMLSLVIGFVYTTLVASEAQGGQADGGASKRGGPVVTQRRRSTMAPSIPHASVIRSFLSSGSGSHTGSQASFPRLPAPGLQLSGRHGAAVARLALEPDGLGRHAAAGKVIPRV
jgi:hypothetical protein